MPLILKVQSKLVAEDILFFLFTFYRTCLNNSCQAYDSYEMSRPIFFEKKKKNIFKVSLQF